MNPETTALFISERRGVLSRKTVWSLVRRYGDAAALDIAAHPHMLRHACGFALADQGADTRLIQDSWDAGIFSIRCVIQPPVRRGLKNCGGSIVNNCQLLTIVLS
ncbi:tyrosine-type recombinase/integrase [Candidatus Methylospira mobilis]|nr:tyrosine-type recombinase/integrase [Candidatus Methylospira mobilis]WNV03381.1 tyrosine-type recombinase/integrase [Candidatus Methylospira mobilis]